MRRHRAPHGVAPVEQAYVRARDPDPREVAAWQAMVRGWVLMWSPWRRQWTAIARFGSAPLILDDPSPHELLRECQQAEMAAAYGRPARV